MRKNFEFRCMLDPSFKILQSNRMGRCHLKGLHTYDLLRNQNYYNQFQYEAADVEGRDKLIEDEDQDDSNNAFQSDFVRLILNLAYIHEDERLVSLKFKEAKHFDKMNTLSNWARNTANNNESFRVNRTIDIKHK